VRVCRLRVQCVSVVESETTDQTAGRKGQKPLRNKGDNGKMKKTEERLKRIERVLGTFICWVTQSSVGVISVSEAEALLRDLQGKKPKKK
jgi:hypothetical protein